MPTEISPAPETLVMQRHFTGLNVYVPPQDMGPNEVQIADNVYVKGGEFRSRPGKIAQLATPFAEPVYVSEPYMMADGTSALLLTSGGKLYTWQKGSAVTTELLATVVYAYADLVIQSTTSNVTSTSRPFTSGDVGLVLVIEAGNGFIAGSYTVSSVSSGIATLDASCGTASSTGGSATLGNSFHLNSSQTFFTRSGKYMYIVDGQILLTDLAIPSAPTQVSSATHPFGPADVGKQLVITSGEGFQYTDLSISASSSSEVTSAARPFLSTDTGGTLVVTGGTGFTPGTYTVASVAAGVAALANSASAGTENSTGGSATFTTSGGSGFIVGTYTIDGVAGGVATLSETVGSVGTASGSGTLSGPVYRVSLNVDSTYFAGTVTSLTPPASPTASLSSTVLDSCDDPTQWTSLPPLNLPFANGPSVTAGYSPSPANLLTNAGMAGWADSSPDSNPPPMGWQDGGNSMDNGLKYDAAYFDIGGPSWMDEEIPAPNYLQLPGMNTIVGATDASPIVVKTATPHGFANGQQVYVAGVQGNTAANGFWQVASATSSTFALAGSAGNGVYTSGGAVGQVYLDLAVVALSTGGAGVDVSSASRPFQYTDTGSILVITAGLTPGKYTVVSVSNGTARLSASPGTSGAAGGIGFLYSQPGLIASARVFAMSAVNVAGNGTFDFQLFGESSGLTGTYPTDYSITGPVVLTDLRIWGPSQVSSASYNFTDADLSKTITVLQGNQWNEGTFVITGVGDNRAAVYGDLGTESGSGPAYAVLGILPSGTGWGNNNYTLQAPIAATVNNGYRDYKETTNSSVIPQVGSLTAATSDFDFLRFRLWGGSQNGCWIGNPVLTATDVRLIPAASPGGNIAVSGGGTIANGGYCLGGAYLCRDYTAQNSGVAVPAIIDLVLSSRLTVSSAAYGFTPADVGRFLAIYGGAGFTPGRYTITAVDGSGNATLDGVAGTYTTAASITAASDTNPIAITLSTSSGLTSGQCVQIAGVGGNAVANGDWVVTVVSSTEFTLNGSKGNAAFTSGGTATALGQAVLLDAAAPDYSQYDTIAIGYNPGPLSGTIPFQVGFQPAGASTEGTVWTNPPTQVSDTTGTYLSVDISTVAASILETAQYLILQITTDLPNTVDLTNLFTFGPISGAGNLSIGFADYSYVISEVEDTAFDSLGNATGDTTDGQIESDASGTSTSITPTGSKAQATLTLAAPVNASTNTFYLYRYGGIFPSEDSYPTARLVAMLPTWTDTLDAAYTPWITWDHTTLTVTDNTPDSAIYTATTLATDRGATPMGAQCACEWQGRLCLAVGSTIYVSWLIEADQAAGLYYNSVNIPNDPYGAIKGMQGPVGGLDNDPVTALVPFGASLLILKQRSIWVLTGVDATNFSLSEFMAKGGANAGVGCVAPRAWALVNQRIWFLGPDCMWQYDGGDSAEPVSMPIEDLINPAVGGQPAIAASAYVNAALLSHGRRCYLFMPTGAWNYSDLVISPSNSEQVSSVARPFLPSDVGKALTITGGIGFINGPIPIESVANGIATLGGAAGSAGSVGGMAILPGDANNTVAYVWDSRQGGWTRFLQMNVTTATSLSMSTDTDDMYMGGVDGQIYQLSYANPGDVAAPGAAPAAVSWMVRSRGFGREQEGESWWRTNKGNWVLARLTLPEASTVLLAAGVVRDQFVSSAAHALSSGVGIGLRDRVRSDLRGDAFFAQVSGATIGTSIVTALAVDLTRESIVSRV
ncbi:MAG: beta strand repeat-containing protein [Capsulimonadaceae bacterium]